MVQTFIEDPPYIQAGRQRRVDYLGFGFMVVFLGMLQLVLDKGQEVDWFAAPWVRWCAFLSAAGFVAFVVRELTTDAPIVNLRVLANRNFAIGTALITALGVVIYGTTALLPLFLQTLLGYPALQSGLTVSPRGLGALTASIVVGRLIGRVDSRILIAAGFSVTAGSALVYSRMNLDIAQRNVVWTSLVNGFAGPLMFVPLTTTAMGTLTRRADGAGDGHLQPDAEHRGERRHRHHHDPPDARHAGAPGAPGGPPHALRPGVPALAGGRPRPPRPAGGLGRRRSRRARASCIATLVRQATLLSFLDTFRLLAFLAMIVRPARPAVQARPHAADARSSSTERPAPDARVSRGFVTLR